MSFHLSFQFKIFKLRVERGNKKIPQNSGFTANNSPHINQSVNIETSIKQQQASKIDKINLKMRVKLTSLLIVLFASFVNGKLRK